MPPGKSLGVLGLEPGVPGLSPSFCFSDGVLLLLLLRLLGGRSRSLCLSLSPLACSPLVRFLGPSSSPPTSTTRSPSLLSPESDSWPLFLRSLPSVLSRLADISSFGVDERIGERAEMGERARWFSSRIESRGSRLEGEG